ncbi:MAG TPA: hypothetical protein VFL57_22505, partial [Bryobacteraceae bacterium]|nr:hypothetical protein [Bryobacteraceae bacterium]
MSQPAFGVVALGTVLICLPAALLANDSSDKSTASAATAGGVRLEGGSKDGGRRIRVGGIAVGGGYSRGWPGYGFYGPPYWGPVWYGAAYNPWGFGPGWGWYDPFWYSPLAVHPGYWTGFGRGEGMGEVKLDTEARAASVYIDGAYAGPVKDRRSMWLRPGTYDLQLRDAGKKV